MNTKNAIARRLDPRARRGLLQLFNALARPVESLVFGGAFKERILLWLLGAYYSSKLRREWRYRKEPPHFFDQRISFFELGFGKQTPGPYALARGFMVAELLRDGDRLLDIGCGDGFYDKRFYSARCSQIDAIDIDVPAIQAAQSNHRGANIAYARLDAVHQPFPHDQYDVIVMDGAIGHFAAEDSRRVLEKAAPALGARGLFVGSESLGQEGSDHLQFFASVGDLAALFTPFFKHVELHCETYRIGGMVRQEAYWRCSNSSERLQEGHWQEYPH